jgi:hypothetical protein
MKSVRAFRLLALRRGPPLFALRAGVVVLAGALVLSSGVASAGAGTLAPVATTAQASSVTPAAATVTGSVNPKGTATNWYFQYGPSTNAAYGNQTASRSAGAGTGTHAVAASLTGLAPSTSYHFRIVASSSAGTTYGGDGTFNTTAIPAVVTIAASHVTSNSASLNATVNPEGLSTKWYFEYGLTAAYGTKTHAATIPAGPNFVSVTQAVANLNAVGSYHYRIVAVNSAGTAYGNGLLVVTGAPITLNASPAIMGYGGFVSLSGTLSSGAVGTQVTIESERFDATTFTGLATTTTASGGTWSYVAHPSARTTYKAVVTTGSSSPVVVSTRPAVSIRIGTTSRITTSVVGAISFGARVLQLQRLSAGTWVTWKSVRLNSLGRATFATSLPMGRTTIRMAIGPAVIGIDQAGPGYLAGMSRTLVYSR